MPQVSVILTSFNHGRFIREAIESVLNQSLQDFELIIWDDASVDDSWEIIQSYSDPRIKAFKNPENKGPTLGVNKAIFEIAQGEYIAIHHSDDAWELDKLQKQVDFLEANQKVGAVFTNVQPIDERGAPLADTTHFYYSIFSQPNRSRYEWLRFFFLSSNALCHPSILIRKRCYEDCGPYLDMLAQTPDFDMWVRLCAKYEIHVLEVRLIKFRVLDREMNTSGNRPVGRIRATNELYKLLQRYRSLAGKDRIFKIFPDFITYDCGSDTDAEYVLARVCLESAPNFHRQFLAIEILFDILNNPLRRETVERVYNFSAGDFITITGQYDLFSREEILRLEAAVVERDGQISTLNQTVSKIYQSASWRLTKPLRLFSRLARYGLVNGDRQKLLQALSQRYHALTLQTPAKRQVSLAYNKAADPSTPVQNSNTPSGVMFCPLELNTLNTQEAALAGRRLKIAISSQPEYFRFMYEHELESFADVFEFNLRIGMHATDFKPLIEYGADYNFFFRGEHVPDGVLEQLKGVRVALSSEPFPRMVTGRNEYTIDSIQRYLSFRSIRQKPFDYVFHYDEASLPFLRWDQLFVSGQFAFPVATSIYHLREQAKTRDLFFIGRSTPHREAHFGQLKHRYNFLHICHGIWGEPLVDYLCAAKICLNVHAENEVSWEPRMQMMLACGAFVISERITPNSYLRPGVDYVEISSPHELHQAVDYYLQHEAERLQIARNGYERVREVLDSKISFQQLIADLDGAKYSKFTVGRGSPLLNFLTKARGIWMQIKSRLRLLM